MIINIIILILFLLVAYYFANKKFALFTVLFFVFYQYIWMSASIFIIENGAYISEQKRYGFFAYANVYLFLFYIVSIISFVFFFQFFNKVLAVKIPKFKFNKVPESKILFYLLLFLLSLAYLNYFLSPNPLTNDSVNKFNFWKTAKFPFLSSFLGSIMGYIAFGSGLIFGIYKKKGVLLIVLYFLYIILIGHKFTGLIIGSYAILLAFYHVKKIKFKLKIKHIFNKYIIISVVLLFSLIHSQYSKLNPYRHLKLTPTEAIFYRTFNLQGHLFWGVTEKYVYNNEPKTYKIKELDKGMHILMDEFYPRDQLKHLPSVIKRGVSWTNAYPTMLLRIYPLPLALVVHFLIFGFLPLFFVILLKMIKNGNFIFSVVIFQLITWINNAYIMAYFFRLVKVFIILIFILLIAYIFKKYRDRKK